MKAEIIENPKEKKPNYLIYLLFLIIFIFSVNYLAMKFYWYSSIWYFDMPMHFLGGFWISMAIIWFLKIKEISYKTLVKTFLLVLLIGVLWEIFEIVLNNMTTRNPFNILDTLSDIFFDLGGGLFALFYFRKKLCLL